MEVTGLLGLIILVADIYAVLKIAQSAASTGQKALWWIVASIPFVGFIPYFIFGIRKGKKPEDSQ